MRLSETEEAAFGLLAQEVFALDRAVQSVALEKAGRESCCALRDTETGAVIAAATTPDTELPDPLVLMLAEGRDGRFGQDESRNPQHLLFVVLAYADLVQIVARFGRYDHVGLAVHRYADVYTLGKKLIELLDRRKQNSHSPVHADASVLT
jgi:hypothetical protein